MDFKERYIKMRNEKQYDLQFFYDYYISKGGLLSNPDEFTEHFLYIHEVFPTPAGFPSIKRIVGEIDRQAILGHMDTVFGLTILEDKEFNFIKVVV